MFQNIFQTYTLESASVEIFFMLFVMFVLGVSFGWYVKPQTEIVWHKKNTSKKLQTPIPVSSKTWKDDFQLIEGIDAASEKILFKYGVRTYKDIVSEDVLGLEKILKHAGSKYELYNPATWPDQARLAMNKNWSELEEYQEILRTHTEK